jgi:hypothetical protein
MANSLAGASKAIPSFVSFEDFVIYFPAGYWRLLVYPVSIAYLYRDGAER